MSNSLPSSLLVQVFLHTRGSKREQDYKWLVRPADELAAVRFESHLLSSLLPEASLTGLPAGEVAIVLAETPLTSSSRRHWVLCVGRRSLATDHEERMILERFGASFEAPPWICYGHLPAMVASCQRRLQVPLDSLRSATSRDWPHFGPQSVDFVCPDVAFTTFWDTRQIAEAALRSARLLVPTSWSFEAMVDVLSSMPLVHRCRFGVSTVGVPQRSRTSSTPWPSLPWVVPDAEADRVQGVLVRDVALGVTTQLRETVSTELRDAPVVSPNDADLPSIEVEVFGDDAMAPILHAPSGGAIADITRQGSWRASREGVVSRTVEVLSALSRCDGAIDRDTLQTWLNTLSEVVCLGESSTLPHRRLVAARLEGLRGVALSYWVAKCKFEDVASLSRSIFQLARQIVPEDVAP